MKSNLSETAMKLFQKESNCAQAIFSVYGEQLGLRKETCLKIASGFGGGIARTRNVCGALTGAVMAIGLKCGGIKRGDREKTYEVAEELLSEFKTLHGSIICEELINHDLITNNDVEQAFEKGVFDNCPKFVEDVSIILEKLIF
ncbi:MAG: C-GCAxxG-C-C family protein [Promethearchaeota archaeon]